MLPKGNPRGCTGLTHLSDAPNRAAFRFSFVASTARQIASSNTSNWSPIRTPVDVGIVYVFSCHSWAFCGTPSGARRTVTAVSSAWRSSVMIFVKTTRWAFRLRTRPTGGVQSSKASLMSFFSARSSFQAVGRMSACSVQGRQRVKHAKLMSVRREMSLGSANAVNLTHPSLHDVHALGPPI